MKKYFSIIEMAADSTCSKILWTLLSLSAVDFIWFGIRIAMNTPSAEDYQNGIYCLTLLDLLEGPVLPVCFVAAVLFLMVVLSEILNNKNTNPVYTLRRLNIPKSDVALTLIGYYFMIYILLFLVQIICFLIMGLIFRHMVGSENMGIQDLLLIFIMNRGFAGRLLPIGLPVIFVCEIVYLLAFAVAEVREDMNRAMKKEDQYDIDRWLTRLPGLLCIFYINMGDSNVLCIIGAVLAFGAIIYNIYNIRHEDNEYEDGEYENG